MYCRDCNAELVNAVDQRHVVRLCPLHAAAHALLAALKEVLEQANFLWEAREALQRARATIAEAEGA